MNVLISVIIPVYNAEPFLDRCIQSILKQTHKHLEIILINDGSTDSSGAICEKYALQDKRIRVEHIKNGGSSIARNQGLRLCTGEYIGFVDSDDWIQPNMYEELLYFSTKNNLKVVETNSTYSSMIDHVLFEKSKVSSSVEDRNAALKRIISGKKFAVWRRLYHHSILENRYFIQNILHQDVYYTIDIIKEVSHIGFLNFPFYVYNNENQESVIRSKYSLKKLKSIGAGDYVVKQTRSYCEEIQVLARHYLVKFLTYHYDSLYFHPELDENKVIRRKIRDIIKTNYNPTKFDVYSYAIINLPPPFYKNFLLFNKKRVQIQLKIHKFLAHVSS